MMLRLLLCLFLFPAMAHATIFWDDELEAGNTGYGLIEGAMAYDTSVKVSGNASLRLDYPEMCLQLADIPCGGFMDRNFPQTTTKWTRFYFRMSPGFQVHGVATKWLRSDTNKPNNMSTWWMMWWGSYNWGNTVQATSIGTYNLYSSKSLVPGQWHCIEMRETLNTPGVANGINESWIDGVQVMGVYNMTYLAAGESYKFINNRLFRQGGYGSIWLDRLAVGDQRIGCLGSQPPPSGDTTPPTPPSTPVLTVSGASQISLAWTNGTDTSGVTSTTILRCAGAACTPATALTVMNSGATVGYADTSVSSSTTYGYALKNGDAAGNLSTVSATAYATTGSTYRTTTITDFFNRADNTDLGASWDAGYTTYNGPVNALNIVNSQLRVSATDDPDSLETHNTALANNQWGQVTFTSLTAADANQKSPGVIIRANAPGNLTGYSCRVKIYTGTPRSRIEKWNGLVSWEELASESSTTWLTGDKLRCEAEGTALRLYQIRGTTETLVLSTTDATYTSGRVGLIHYISPAGTVADIQIDDFIAGEFSVSAPTPPAITSVTSGSRVSTTVTWSGTPTTIRVATEFGSVVEPLSAFPDGLYTFPTNVLSTMTNFVCFYARDAQGVENTTGYVCGSVPYTADTEPPVLSNGLPTATLPNGTTSTVISVTLDKGAVCRYDTTDIAYDSMQTASPMGLAGLTASGTVTGLSTGANVFYVRCSFTDLLGEEHPNTTSTTITVTVAASTADTTAPSTVTNLVVTVLSSSQAELAWSVATDNVAIAGYNVYLSVGDGNTTYLLESQTDPTANRTVVNLSAGLIHNFVVKARDTSQNLSAAYSNLVTVTTQAVPDVTPPSTMTNLRIIGVYSQSVILTWDTGQDDRGEPTATIESCTGVACSDFTQITTKLTLQQLIVALTPNTTYSFRGLHVDQAGNPSAGYSNVVTITTAASGLPYPRLEAPYSRPRWPTSFVPTSTFTDTFTRADGALGAGWQDGWDSPATIVSNQAQAPSYPINSGGAVAVDPGLDQYGQFTVAGWGTTRFRYLFIFLRDANSVGYKCVASTNDGVPVTTIEKKIAGVSSSVLASSGTAWEVGDTMTCLVRGSTITLRKNGVTLLTATDLSPDINANGAPGFYLYEDTGGGSTADIAIDNWVSGTVAGTERLQR